MTPEEQRIALDKWAGWRRWSFGDPWPEGLRLADKRFNGYIRRVIKKAPADAKTILLNIDDAWTHRVDEVIKDYTPVSHWVSRDGSSRRSRPDYLNDLNAVHLLEKKLPDKHKRSYAFILAQVLDTTPTVDLDDQFLNVHATASQRCEALLKTLNLWKGGNP